MPCKKCGSLNEREFPSEINIHFSGQEGREKPTVWVFPHLFVCLDCGRGEFTILETELQRLNAGVE